MKRFFVVFFTLVVVFSGSVFLFHDRLLTSGTKVFLKRTFPSHASYRDITAHDGRISIVGLHLKEDRYQIHLEEVEFSLEFKKLIAHPKQWLTFLRSPKQSWTGALVVMKQYGMRLTLDKGVLQLGDHRYFFTFQNGERNHEIGKLSISHDPRLMDHPFLQLHFNMRGNQLLTQLHLEEIPSERFLHLAAFAFPETMAGFVGAQGNLELAASIIFEQDGKIDELSTRFACENFEVRYPQLDLEVRMGSLRGDLNYPEGAYEAGLPVWKKMLCDLTLENGEVAWGSKFGLNRLGGSLSLDPRVDPSLSVKGELVGQENPLVLQLEGKGAIHEDHAYWLEFDLHLDDYTGAQCGAFLSICRPDLDSHVIQLEASRLLPNQVEMLKGYFSRFMPRLKAWKIEKGSFGGKLIALFEKGNLSHFEIKDFVGENVDLVNKEQITRFSRIEAEGRLFEEFSFEIDLKAAHFFGLFSNTFKEAYATFRQDDPAHLSTRVRFVDRHVETEGSIEFLPFHESLQFGFKSQQPFPSGLKEVQEGWAHSEKLSEHLYAPFVTHFSEDLDVKGDVDLVALFDGKEMEFALQIDQFHAKHPLLELCSNCVGEKGRREGRAKVTFNVETEEVKGHLPLLKTQGYDCTYGVIARDLEGTLVFRGHDLWGEVSDGALFYDGQPLLQHARFKLSLGDRFVLQDLQGILPLNTDKDFQLHVTQLDDSTLNFSVLEENIPLIHFDGKKKEEWEGKLSVKGMKDLMEVRGDWDIFHDRGHLEMVGEELQLVISKQGREYLLHRLKVGNSTWKGLVVPSLQGFTLAQIEMETDNLYARGEGTLFIDLPSSSHTFGIRSDILMQGEVRSPFNLPFQGKQSAKIAYSPEIGCIITGLELESEEGQLNLSHLEHSFKSQKTLLNNCSFVASSSLIDRCIQAQLLPAMIRNFRFSKEMQGMANVELSKGKTKINAVLNEGANWKKEGNRDLFATVLLEGNHCQLKLAEENEKGLQFEMRLGEGFPLTSVKGKLGSLSAQLKPGKEKQLKGHIHLDFTVFDELFDLPITHYIEKWKAGGGYTLEGTFTQQPELRDWEFKGKVLGRQFECGGYQLRSLEARVEMLPDQITIENLDVTDDAGKLWIGEGALMKAGPYWVFSFPLVEVRGLHPSFLRKLAGKEERISPLVIKAGSIENLRGRLDDPKTISGEGSFRFTNISKTGETLYPRNLPVSVIKQMGLDGAMFVPAIGEVDFMLQQGRCYIRTLKNMTSLKNRSEFQSPKNGVIGYLDFNGKIFLDLQVKQKEVRSIPNVTFRVRGTLEQPEITVR